MTFTEPAFEGASNVCIIGKIASGDAEAARLFFESYCDQLLGFVARRISGPIEDAEEITNDIFLAAVDLAHTYDGSCTPLTWLCSLAKNKIVDHRRRAVAMKRIPEKWLLRIDDKSKCALRGVHDPSVSLDELVNQMDRMRLVEGLLNCLTSEQREAVTLRYIEGFSVEETAKIMKRSEKAVERLLERAKERPRRQVLRWLVEDGIRILCLGLLVL